MRFKAEQPSEAGPISEETQKLNQLISQLARQTPILDPSPQEINAKELSFGPRSDLKQPTDISQYSDIVSPLPINTTDVDLEITTAYENVNNNRDLVPIRLSWEGVSYSVQGREFVHGVGGSAECGEILAIMGSSGAGKTSLLNILSGRNTRKSRISGNVKANRQNIATFDYQSYIGYVTQEDILLDTLTPRECLTFAANLRLKGTTESKKNKVETLLKDLKLPEVAENQIGSLMKRGLSGGERRRLAIAVELIVDPCLLFLDGSSYIEPTSGLDSTSAFTVVQLLHLQAVAGLTVVLTIHQPSARIFALVDRLILMAEGHSVYQGPAKAALSYFQALGYDPPPLVSEADFYMKILHVVNRDAKTPEEETRLQTFIDSYKNRIESEDGNKPLPELLTNECINKPGLWQELQCLCGRAWLNSRRNLITTRVKILQTFLYAIVLVAVYSDLGEGESGVQDRAGVLFFCIVCLLQGGILNVILAFPVERALFLKEQKQSLYGVLPYFLAKVIAEFPMYAFTPICFGSIVYFGVGLNGNDIEKFFLFRKTYTVLITLLVHGVGESIGLIIGALVQQVSVAPNIGILALVPFIMFAGYFSRTQSIPRAFRWVSYISVSANQPYRYGFEALCWNEFTDLHLKCENCDKPRCAPCEPLKNYAFQEDLWEAIYILTGYLLATKTVSFFVLKSQSRSMRA